MKDKELNKALIKDEANEEREEKLLLKSLQEEPYK